MSRTVLVADRRVKDHDAGPGQPEQPARFTAVENQLKVSGLRDKLLSLDARFATDEDLALVHTREYIELVKREVAEARGQLSTGDTTLNQHSETVARLAVGSTFAAVDAVFSDLAENAFCLVRPPGHHAGPASGMGFCIFNNVALAARYAQAKYKAERVLIVDWDVHHGNGTQDVFYEDDSVLFFSTHQSPWYPGTGASNETGEGSGAGKTINCPLPAGTGSSKVFAAFEEQLLPAVSKFRPDFIVISAGFDSRVGDPLGQFLLKDDDFQHLTRLMTDTAAKYCSNRLVSVLEGGYSLEGLALAADAHVRALLGQ
jgi:acetoin utilization deacetylase AcuC-like enzyme